MANPRYFETIISNIQERSAESTVSMLGITNPRLRKYLSSELRDADKGTAFLSDPVFESMFPWEKGEFTMDQLASELLDESVVDAMDKAGDHRFGRDWYPFKHQIKAWRELSGEQCKSVVVTSGTGSGKTECFMVPILNDLATEYNNSGEKLVGTRALFIYPLNALINSQRERLRAWTAAFDEGVRFSLYNGNTEENKHPDQGKCPNEILTRKHLREEPAPILVTNATMLEYMLVRQVDNPIIEKSQGKLRWIVLDEAHTYIGSQAAEMSLLLRRVLHSFRVNAKDVRFVATSATIGDDDANRKLQDYLASLAGISSDQVTVVGGRRAVPSIEGIGGNSLSLDEIKEIDSGEKYSSKRYSKLAGNEAPRKLRKILSENKYPQKLSQLATDVFGSKGKLEDILKWIDIASNTIKPGPQSSTPDVESVPFLPVRLHLFHQVMSGLWCCSDKNCNMKHVELGSAWPFGNVYTQRKSRCDCGGPIYELVFCKDCNEPHLMAAEDKAGRLVQFERESVDEFSLDYESSEETDGNDLEEDSRLRKQYISPEPVEEVTYPVSLNKEDLSLTGLGSDSFDLNLILDEQIVCSNCRYSANPSPFRQGLLGTPFYISNTVHTLLEACQEGDNAADLPARGRRLITFTDSRQGTARISTKIQQDSERNSLRGLVYGITANNQGRLTDSELAEKKKKIQAYEKKIAQYKSLGEDEIAQDFDIQRKSLVSEINTTQSLPWGEAVTRLQSSSDVEKWGMDYYSDLNPELFPKGDGSRILSQMLLLREFARRPKRQNSLETLGLVSVQYPALQKVTNVPKEWNVLNLTLEDWQEFLKVMLDFYVRANTIIDIPEEWTKWMGARVYPKTVLNPDSEESPSTRILKWPQVRGLRSNRMIRLLSAACNLDLNSNHDKDVINQILKAAWKTLTSETSILRPEEGSLHFRLVRSELAFSSVERAWICPITHRLIDTTFKGLSPYLPFKIDNVTIQCERIDIPVCSVDVSEFISDQERRNHIRSWIADQPQIESLRQENLWTDISDRVLEGGRFFRAVEHSAQQPAHRLKHYESLFKAGKINILSCSTTMEMGVDIGGISVVAMNNVPPHPANYLQRAGRAGRRGETQALSFTICKDNPHERGVFVNPQWPFVTSIPAPYIVLNSEEILQRHINSLLLSYFLKRVHNPDGQLITNLTCEWFFISPDEQESPYQRMLTWMTTQLGADVPEFITGGISRIVNGSLFSTTSQRQLINNSLQSLQNVADKWIPSYERVKAELDKVESASKTDPYRRKIEHDLMRIGGDYLLSELVSSAFLPGYGFPSGIATFDNYSIHDYRKNKFRNAGGRIDNIGRMKQRPGRDISVAIREYAPGADVIIDGLVYRSAGILLNKFNPDSSYSESQKMMMEWRCHKCGHIDQTPGSIFESKCSECGVNLKDENIKEFIEPTGFAVDFYSSPSTDITTQAYVPVQEPWVTANSPLSSLYNPILGSYRSSRKGHIFHHSSGESEQGFAICLRCGRAESMTINGEFPPNLRPLSPHDRLQGKVNPEKNTRVCGGSDEPYAVKPSIHLGVSSQTDVFELYLKHPKNGGYIQHQPNSQFAWTLAVVLRQALADIHGINADETGYTVKASTIEGCSFPISTIVLFDKCGGGAGFSSASPQYIKTMLQKASTYLDCPDACESACQSCLLGYDTRFHVGLLDRNSVVEYLNEITPLLELPQEARLFGDGTSFCMENIEAEIVRLSTKGFDSAYVYLGGEYNEWDIASSALKDKLFNLLNIYSNVHCVLPRKDANKLNSSDKDDLWVLAKLGVKFHRLESDQSLSGSLLAQVTSPEITVSLGSTISEASCPNDGFWDLSDGCLVQSHAMTISGISELEEDSFKPEASSGDVELEITNECDGKSSHFGLKVWKKIVEAHPETRNRISSGSLISIRYLDAYVCSPLTLILFSSLIEGLRSTMGESWHNKQIELVTGNKKPNSNAPGLYADWHDKAIQQEVFEKYFARASLDLKVTMKDKSDMPHSRSLILDWEDGSQSTIRFDHGMGYWKISGRPNWINLNSNSDKQVEDIQSASNRLSVLQGKSFPTQIFIKSSK